MLTPDASHDGPAILHLLRKWEHLGRPDPSPEWCFDSSQGIAWLWVKGGQVYRRDQQSVQKLADPETVRMLYLAHQGEMPRKADSPPASGGPVPPSRPQRSPVVPGTLGEEPRCRECGALGWDWCPGCRSEIYQSRWGN